MTQKKIPNKHLIVYAFIDSQNLNLGVANDVLSHHTHKLLFKYSSLLRQFRRYFTYVSDIKNKLEKKERE